MAQGGRWYVVEMTTGNDIRNILEWHTTERRGGNRGRGSLFGAVFIIVDDIEMDRLERYFSVPEQNF